MLGKNDKFFEGICHELGWPVEKAVSHGNGGYTVDLPEGRVYIILTTEKIATRRFTDLFLVRVGTNFNNEFIETLAPNSWWSVLSKKSPGIVVHRYPVILDKGGVHFTIVANLTVDGANAINEKVKRMFKLAKLVQDAVSKASEAFLDHLRNTDISE